MSYSQLDHKALLQKISQDPAVKAKQYAIPAAATLSMLRVSNRLRSIFDRQDQLQFSAELVHTLHYIAEHDFIAYLTITKQYDLIRKLFWDKDLFAQQLAMIEKLEHEKEEKAQRDELILDQARLALSKKHLKALSTEQAKFNEERQLVAQGLYQYFQLLEQNIYSEFYDAQIILYQEAYTIQRNRMQAAFDIVLNDPTISKEDKKAFQKLVTDFERQWKTVEAINIRNPDNSLSFAASQIKYRQAQTTFHQYNHAFTNLLAKYPDNAGLQKIAQEHQVSNQHMESKFVANVEIRDEKLEEIKPHVQSTQTNLKEDKLKFMQDVLTITREINRDSLSNQELIIFDASTDNMSHYSEKAELANDNLYIDAQYSKFKNEIQKIQKNINFTKENQSIISQIELLQFNSITKNPGKIIKSNELHPVKTTSNIKNQMFFHRNEHSNPQLELKNRDIEFDELSLLYNEINCFLDQINETLKNQTLEKEDRNQILELKQLASEIKEAKQFENITSKMHAMEKISEGLKKELSEITNSLDTILDIFEDSKPKLSI